MYLNFRKGRDLLRYLEEHHHDKWEEITHIPIFGSGGFYSFRSVPFIFSKDNLHDDQVKLLKTNYRGFIIFALAVFITIIPLFLVVMLP